MYFCFTGQPDPGDVDEHGASLSQRFSKWFSGGEGKVKQGTKEEMQQAAEPG